jgi:hypothetical protein
MKPEFMLYSRAMFRQLFYWMAGNRTDEIGFRWRSEQEMATPSE